MYEPKKPHCVWEQRGHCAWPHCECGTGENADAATQNEPKLLRVPTTFHSVEEVLETAKKMELPNVLVLSEREDGKLIILDTNLTRAQAVWLCERIKAVMLVPEIFERIGP